MKYIRVGLSGLGTVGAEVFSILAAQDIFKVTAVSARDKSKNRGIDVSGVAWVDNPVDLATRDDIDVVVEVMGGSGDPAYSLVKTSLQNKKSVVTANKALLAHHGRELAQIAEDHQVGLYYEAAVAGGIPIIKMLREGLAANEIQSIYGILNGTCNYILTTMEQTGKDFTSVLKDAQKLGYAESDSTLDIDGGDTGHKLSLLTALAFGCLPDFESISVSGIRNISADDILAVDEFGYRIKLIGQAVRQKDKKILQIVSPSLVSKSSLMANVGGVLNAVLTEGHLIGQSFVSGRGAGAQPTASAVIADLIDLSRGVCIVPFGKPVPSLSGVDQSYCRGQFPEEIGPFYLRLMVKDSEDVMTKVFDSLNTAHISVQKVIQKQSSSAGCTNIIILTEATEGQKILDVTSQISKSDFVIAEPFIMPVLKI